LLVERLIGEVADDGALTAVRPSSPSAAALRPLTF